MLTINEQYEIYRVAALRNLAMAVEMQVQRDRLLSEASHYREQRDQQKHIAKLLADENEKLRSQVEALTALLNTPETEEFDKAVPLEAAHQIQRWTAAHDAGKQPEDWFWLLGYLAGKALASFKAGDLDKSKHHCISSAAALRNWHAHIRSGQTAMRPGIAEPDAARTGEKKRK